MEATSAARDVYDSAAPGTALGRELGEFWRRRGLVRLLVTRDLVLRYKRSLLGVWWTLLNPLLKMLVLWAVLSGVFKAADIGVPYIVYLGSGILVVTFFEQAVQASGGSLVNSSGVISKVHVPAPSFAISAVLAAGVTMLISVIPLLIIQVATGVGIPWTIVLVPLPAIALMAMAAGVGLVVASAAVRLYDVLDFTTVLLQLLAFVTPTFYPLSSVSEPYRTIIEANPLTQVLIVMRGFFYEGTFAAWWSFAYIFATGALALAIGLTIFARTWRTSVVML